MKITQVRAVEIDIAPKPRTNPRFPKQTVPDLGGPMARYPELRRSEWMPGRNWKRTACVVTAEDGTFGLGITLFSGPVVRLINDHLAQLLTGQNPMATERLFDLMQRATSPFGTAGLASFAISAVDNAIWDLKGKLLQKLMYEIIGGPQKQKIFC